MYYHCPSQKRTSAAAPLRPSVENVHTENLNTLNWVTSSRWTEGLTVNCTQQYRRADCELHTQQYRRADCELHTAVQKGWLWTAHTRNLKNCQYRNFERDSFFSKIVTLYICLLFYTLFAYAFLSAKYLYCCEGYLVNLILCDLPINKLDKTIRSSSQFVGQTSPFGIFSDWWKYKL